MTPNRIIHILLAEDEPGDTRLLQLAMRKSGFPIELHCVNDGEEALAYLARTVPPMPAAARPDLILLDLKMPRRGGLDTLRAIKQIEPLRAIPVVILTTSGLEADIAAAYRLGAAGYVPKLADLNEFIAAIGTLTQYWFSLVRLPAQNP